MIRYLVDASATLGHDFDVTLIVPRPQGRVQLALPVWVPGSYLVREFARHLHDLRAEQGGRALAPRQLDKASWSVECTNEHDLVVRYRIHAFDVSVRAAYLDASRGFFNGTSVCLRVDGRASEPHGLAITGLAPGWDVATTMTPSGDPSRHEFVAADYDELVDHPVELGRFRRGRFEAGGASHELVVAGALPDFDAARLEADVARICTAEIAFWHGAAGRPPFDRYLFLLNAVDEGRGGLEHRASTALVCPRRDLPRRAASAEGEGHGKESGDGYVDVLGLFAHEYFHAWNVKRLKPRDFATLDYSRENYSELLWFFEGFTSYYDDLLVARAGLIDAARYLKLLGKTMSAVAAAPGREQQSVAAASFDAWVKYYRPDENTPNATVSYYAKGSLVALALDLSLRGEGRGSLDEVMRGLWSGSGGGPIDEAAIVAAIEAVAGRSFDAEIAAWVHGTGELPLEALLGRFGVEVAQQPATLAQRLGLRVSEGPLTGIKVSHVLRGQAAERAGLAPGDELLAANGWRLRRLDDALRLLDGLGHLLVCRDQRVFKVPLDPSTLAGAEAGAVQLRIAADAPAAARALREAWIGG